MTKFLALVPLLAGCGLIDAATSDRPNTTQSRAIADIFSATASFVKVASDPATATDGDLRDMHVTAPYQNALDPDNATTARRGSSTGHLPLDPTCYTAENGNASWNCAFSTGGTDCTAVGNGTKVVNSISGTSTLTCTGLPTVTVTTNNVVFDEAAGNGSGTITVQVANPTIAGWATVDISDLSFCVNEATPAPDGGSVTIDGQGILDNLPFDPLTVRFTDDPVCGTSLIEN